MVQVRKDLTKQKYERLTVLRQSKDDYIRPDGRKEALWECQCVCGNTIKVTSNSLNSGSTKSCGCLQKETQRENGKNTKNLISNEKKYNTYNLSGKYGIGYTSSGEEFYFDLEDYEKIKGFTWYVSKNNYIENTEHMYMHALVMNTINGDYVDHIKHNTFDNRKSKLRIVTPTQNNMNRKIQSNNTSKITGVSFHKASQRWFAHIKINKKQKRVYSDSKEEAIIKRKELEDMYFKEYSYNNSLKKMED